MLKRDDFSAVIFDMDGLVLDTESTFRVAWNKAARDMEFDFSEAFFKSLSGLQPADVERALREYCGADFDFNEFNRASAQCWRRHVQANGIEVKHGFSLLLEFLLRQNVPYCLATNSAAANAYECLGLAGLKDVFPIMISREQVENGKPAPDIFIKAAETLGIPVNRCLVLEDSPVGIEAAFRAGAVTVWIPSAPPVDPMTMGLCDLIFDDLAQLLDAIQS